MSTLPKQRPPLRTEPLQPTVEREGHGAVELVDRFTDPDGRGVRLWRALYTLELMERNGTITRQQLLAGEAFHQHFRVAALDGLKAAALDRLPGNGDADRSPGNDRARRRIAEAIRMLGGQGRLPASCAWHVLGLEWSLREWAEKCLSGRHVVAVGVLVAVLAILEREFCG